MLISGSLFSQETIPFEKYNWTKNTLTGHHWKLEIPIEFGHTLTDDFEYESTDAKEPTYLGIACKAGLKNSFDRGIAFGLGVDYTTNKYLRLNFLIDLDFLYHFGTKTEKGKAFNASFLNQFMISRIISDFNDLSKQEYYLRFNIFQLRIGRMGFFMGTYKGLFRNQYRPVFADKGLHYCLSYYLK